MWISSYFGPSHPLWDRLEFGLGWRDLRPDHFVSFCASGPDQCRCNWYPKWIVL